MAAFATIAASAGTVLLAWVLAGSIRAGLDPTRVPWSATLPVLGGGQPPTHAWSRFHLRYYPMTLVFIAFEMEMMFMYPWAVVFVQEGGKAMAEMGMFLAILALGILYAHKEGALRWQ